MADPSTSDGPPLKLAAEAPEEVTPAENGQTEGKRPDKPDALAVLKALAEASGVFVALTFVGGWSYLSAYYKTFGLNILDWNISVPVVSTIAVYVLSESAWWLLMAGVLIVALTVVARLTKGLSQGWVAAAFVAMLLGTASAGVVRGRLAASRDTVEASSSLPNVAFAAKVMDSEPSCVDYQTYGTMDCKLLLHFNGTYYFFHAVEATDTGSEMNLYSLSDSDLLGVHVQRGLDQTVGP